MAYFPCSGSSSRWSICSASRRLRNYGPGWETARSSLGVDPMDVDTARVERAIDSESVPPPCYLLVQVSPRMCEANRYSVRAWLLGTGEPACLRAGEEAVTVDQLPALLDELRGELLCRQIEPDRAWIELLLPRELLCTDVDQWRVELDFIESIPIGVEHRLVVRSLERASRPRAALALQSRARALRRRLGECCRLVDEPGSREGEAVWIERDDCGGAAPLRRAQGCSGYGWSRAGAGAATRCTRPVVRRAEYSLRGGPARITLGGGANRSTVRARSVPSLPGSSVKSRCHCYQTESGSSASKRLARPTRAISAII